MNITKKELHNLDQLAYDCARSGLCAYQACVLGGQDTPLAVERIKEYNSNKKKYAAYLEFLLSMADE